MTNSCSVSKRLQYLRTGLGRKLTVKSSFNRKRPPALSQVPLFRDIKSTPSIPPARWSDTQKVIGNLLHCVPLVNSMNVLHSPRIGICLPSAAYNFSVTGVNCALSSHQR